MVQIRLLFIVLVGLLSFSCSNTEIFLINSGVSLKSDSTFQSNNKRDNGVDIQKNITWLIQHSELIVIGEISKTRLLVDPDIMKAAFEKAFRENISADGKIIIGNIDKSYILGNTHDITISEVLSSKEEIEIPKILHIYDFGDPFSLHSTLSTLAPKEKYLLFLVKAKRDVLDKNLETITQGGTLATEKLEPNTVYLMTGKQAPGFISLKNNKNLIEKVRNLIKKQ